MLQSCWQISSKVILLPIRCVICIFINKQVDIYSLAKLQYIMYWSVSRFIIALQVSCSIIGMAKLTLRNHLGKRKVLRCALFVKMTLVNLRIDTFCWNNHSFSGGNNRDCPQDARCLYRYSTLMKDGSGSAKRMTPPPLSAYTGKIPCADISNCLIGQFEMSYKTIWIVL